MNLHVYHAIQVMALAIAMCIMLMKEKGALERR